MGVSCSCRAKSAKVISVYRYDPTFASITFSSKLVEQATKDLATFYEAEKANIPFKLVFYYVKALEASCRYERAIVIKIAKFGATGMPYLLRILPFYEHIEELVLWKAQLTSDSVQSLCNSLYLTPALRVINLEDNHLRDEALLSVCRAFSIVRELEELWLAVNDFTAGGVKVMAESLSALPHLRKLGLSFNYFADIGCQYLCQSLVTREPLEVLELGGNKLTSAAVDSLCKLAETRHPLATCDLRKNAFSVEDCERLQKAFTSEVLKLTE